ncbi:spermidine synthase [Nitzschia inconspicua]|uniref:Spermidine synthase n=1 Tax=Nitzschia inconspicua TaxID=303405 RepID=A0A9K3LTL3_9STRA|nr:spermidine synthase [Nitzschia inconspicua]
MLFKCAFVSLYFSAVAVIVPAEEIPLVDTHLEEAREIFNWISGSTEGWITPKQDVRREVPGDFNSPLGVYATKRIEKGEVIARIPWDNIIKSDIPNEDGQLCCGTVTAIAREMKLGNRSKYAPYAVYLNGEADSQIPSAWSEPGKALLKEVLGDGLPPDDPDDWINDWVRRCKGDPSDKIARKAALLVVQRSDDSIMIPAYDAYNHRNGNWTNTKTILEEGKYHLTTATKRIEPGQQIMISYNQCEQCPGRKFGYGTAEILRDYGFVEYFPQRWHFVEDEIEFDLDKDDEGKLVLHWQEQPRETDAKTREQIKVELKSEIQRLRRMKNIDWNFEFEDRDHGIPRHEWDNIWKFVDANIIAMSVALDAMGPMTTVPIIDTKADIRDTARPKETSEEQTCPNDDSGSCGATEDLVPITANGSHYDTLVWEFDDLDYQRSTCDNREIMKFTDFDDLEYVKTYYQEMTFTEKPSTDDICMDLDNIVQICSNYRPQYHEYVSHAAARFVKDVRRVIFIGGGDSMLLHEALKYPNLEKVVGLELDQTVVRKCFKHFKTSPHFDDPRVEWWFGDATKSLLLLPEDYWGSFDLVLVDLSETVVSFSVTAELDVFDALSLLLNPVGVMVKNEHYMEKLSSAFDYSLELHYDSPVICSQVLAFGSNNVDFFHDPVYDPHVENFLYGTMHTPETRYDLMHGYRKNIAPKEKCNLKIPEDPTEQDKTAGILEIVNAEDTDENLPNDLTGLLKAVAENNGFALVSDPIYDHDTSIVVLSDGYIEAKVWPLDQYVAFDIYLWGRTYKMASMKAALVEAVGSKDVSAYRVVVGGVFGTSTWREDQKILGPKVKQLRNCEEDVVKTGKLDPVMASSIAFEEVLPLTLKNEGITAVVVCGERGKECTGLKTLQDLASIKELIPIYECPGLEEKIENAYACETKILEALKKGLAQKEAKLDILIMDPSSSYKMNQIIASITSSQTLRDQLTSEHMVAASWLSDMSETWRRDLLDRFRKQWGLDPASHAEFYLQADEKTFDLVVFSSNNEQANYEYKNLENRLRDRLSDSKATIELRKIHGALYRFKEDFQPRVFKQEDYDSKPGRVQFANQSPFGRQNIFQLVKSDGYKEELAFTLNELWGHLEAAMTGIHMIPSTVRQISGFGEGGMIAAVTSMGDAILVYDGREHIDISLYTDGEFTGLPEKFMGRFMYEIERKMKVALRDDQPRGIGHVINFPSDFEEEEEEVEEA